jgi:hypothetical protein
MNPNYAHKGGVGQAFECKIHHFRGEFRMGVTHHYHHKKKWEAMSLC